MKVYCPQCNATYDVENEQLGMEAICSECNHTFVLTAPSDGVFEAPKRKKKTQPSLLVTLGPYIKLFVFIGIIIGIYFYGSNQGWFDFEDDFKKKKSFDKDAWKEGGKPVVETVRQATFSSIKSQLTSNPYIKDRITIHRLKMKKLGDNKYAGKLIVKVNKTGQIIILWVDIKVEKNARSSEYQYAWKISEYEIQKIYRALGEDSY